METFLHQYGLALLTAIVVALFIIIVMSLNTSVSAYITNLSDAFGSAAKSICNGTATKWNPSW